MSGILPRQVLGGVRRGREWARTTPQVPGPPDRGYAAILKVPTHRPCRLPAAGAAGGMEAGPACLHQVWGCRVDRTSHSTKTACVLPQADLIQVELNSFELNSNSI